MVSGLTSPDKSRFIKELDNKINENNDIIYYSTPSVSPSIPSNSNSSGFGSTVTSNIDGSFGFRTETEYVGLQVDFTSGSGELKVDDTITGNGGWEGFMDSIIDGNSTTGSLFMLYKSGTFDVASTQTLTSSSGWSATYTANTAKTNAIYILKTSFVIDDFTGDPEIAYIMQKNYIDGQIVMLKPVVDKTLTLKSGGNINISADVTVNDDSFVILQYYKKPFKEWDSTLTYTIGEGVNFRNIAYTCVTNTSAGESPSTATSKWVTFNGYFNVLSGGGGGSSGNVKAPVKVATQLNYFNLAIVGDNIDGIVVVAGDRILVKNQTNKADNGIYKVDSVVATVATLTRDVDMPDSSTAYGGTMVYVESGTNEGGSVQILFTNSTTTSDSVLVGTDDQDWYTSSGGEVFTWSNNHDANYFNLNNLEQVSFVDSANDQRGFIAGQTDALRIQVSSGNKSISFREDPYATDVLYINRYGLNQGHATGGGAVNLPINPSAGFISIANDEYITWRNSANTNDALLRFNASDQMEFKFNSIPMLKIDQPNSLLDFEQNNLVRVNNINSYTGDHDIGNTDPFHRIFADRFIPVSENYAVGTTGELRKNLTSTYFDLQSGGTFDIRRLGVGRGNSLASGTDPWFRFTLGGTGTAPDFKIYHNGSTDPKISLTGASGDNAEIYYSIANESLTIKNTVDNPTSLKGIRFNVAGSDIASLVSTGFHPVTDNSHQLGTSTKRWSEVVSSGNVYGTSFVMNVGGQDSKISSGVSPSYSTSISLAGYQYLEISRDELGATGKYDGILEIHGKGQGGQLKTLFEPINVGAQLPNWQIGKIGFDTYDSTFTSPEASSPETFAGIVAVAVDFTSGQEEGKLQFEVQRGAGLGYTSPIVIMGKDYLKPETTLYVDLGVSTSHWRGVYAEDWYSYKTSSSSVNEYFRDQSSIVGGNISENIHYSLLSGSKLPYAFDFVTIQDDTIGNVSSSYSFQYGSQGTTSNVRFKLDGLNRVIHSLDPFELEKISTPSNPTSTSYGKIFFDTATNRLSFKRRNDTNTAYEVVDLEGGGGGGTSFIGFTADDNLNMGTFNITSVDKMTLDQGFGDSLVSTEVGVSGRGGILYSQVPTASSFIWNIGSAFEMTLSSTYLALDNKYVILDAILAPSHTNPSRRYIFQDSSDNHLKIRTDSGLIDLEGGGGGITASDNVTWTGTHTFNNNVTIGSSSTLSINGSIGTDIIPNFDNFWNLGSGTRRWAGFFSTRYRFDATQRSIILNSNNIDYIINSSSGDHRFFNNSTSFPEMTITDGAIVVNAGNRIRSGGSSKIGYYVTNATSTVGTAGTNQLPYISSTQNTPLSSTLDQWFGSENGCCGIQYYSSASQHRIWVKSNGTWVKNFFT